MCSVNRNNDQKGKKESDCNITPLSSNMSLYWSVGQGNNLYTRLSLLAALMIIIFIFMKIRMAV